MSRSRQLIYSNSTSYNNFYDKLLTTSSSEETYIEGEHILLKPTIKNNNYDIIWPIPDIEHMFLCQQIVLKFLPIQYVSKSYDKWAMPFISV